MVRTAGPPVQMVVHMFGHRIIRRSDYVWSLRSPMARRLDAGPLSGTRSSGRAHSVRERVAVALDGALQQRAIPVRKVGRGVIRASKEVQERRGRIGRRAYRLVR